MDTPGKPSPRGGSTGICPARSAYSGKRREHLFTSEIEIFGPDDEFLYYAKVCSWDGFPKANTIEGIDPRRSSSAIITG